MFMSQTAIPSPYFGNPLALLGFIALPHLQHKTLFPVYLVIHLFKPVFENFKSTVR
jgi:hypothetical protein